MLAPCCVAVAVLLLSTPRANAQTAPTLDERLRAVLADAQFTGTIEESLEEKLGRPIDLSLSDLGRRLWFDTVLSLHNDTTCASCHSPTNGFGDTQSIAIGVQSNMVVGADRTGPRNRRRSPMTANAAFYPAQMWDGRFFANSGDPFSNTDGFQFPEPEGTMEDPNITHLLSAQAFLPVTELHEMAGFAGTAGTGTLDEVFAEFDDMDELGLEPLPGLDPLGYRNEPIRQAILDRLNNSMPYRHMFSSNFALPRGASIEFWMVGAALAEFQFIQIAANAPIDKYVRDLDDAAMTMEEKRGALLFFGKAGCVRCHAVAGEANEMFSDFQTHVIAVPQVIPEFGAALGNVIFDGVREDEDYGLEETTGDPAHRYMFRTAPLRNLARSPAFFHNGAFTDLEDAIRHHLTVVASVTSYDPVVAGIDEDLTHTVGPFRPMLDNLDPLLASRIRLTDVEITNLVTFVRDALLDEDAVPGKQCAFIPEQDEILSGALLEYFPDCPEGHQGTVPPP